MSLKEFQDACFKGDIERVRAMLATFEDFSHPVEMRDKFGWTALHWAACGGHLPIIQVLLATSKDPFTLAAAKNLFVDETALRWAARSDLVPIVRALLPYAFDFPPVKTFDESVRFLLRRAHRRRAWAFLETSLPDDLARALPDDLARALPDDLARALPDFM